MVEWLEDRSFSVYHVPDMRRTTAGLPDILFWHPDQPGRLYAWELKRESGRVRPEQVVAIAHLATVPGIDARIVRPSDWEALRNALLEPLTADAPARADRGGDEGEAAPC